MSTFVCDPDPVALSDLGRGTGADGSELRRFQVELAAIPGEEREFVRAMRLVGRITSSEALEIFDGVRCGRIAVLVAGVERSTADRIAGVFRRADIPVRVEGSTLFTPMLCRPQVTGALDWRLRNAGLG